MPRGNGSAQRCLTTPTPGTSRRDETARRSRSRSRRDVQSRSSHEDRDYGRGRSQSYRDREKELRLQQERVRRLEAQLDRDRSVRQSRPRSRQRSPRVSRQRSREPLRPCSRARNPPRCNSSRRSLERHDENVRSRRLSRDEQQGPRATPPERARTPSFSANDVADIINSLRHFKPKPLPVDTVLTANQINHKNILPDFDPSSKNQRVDIWLKKVNECATVYGWDEKTTIHFAMQKLQGLAKVWYESLNSILFNWSEWQLKLMNAFPCEQNYGQALEEMLKRKSRYNEPIELYYYEKLALVNQCDIDGKRAVDCIIHGLSDKTTKSSALALRCTHPDQLLQFLMSNKETSSFSDRNINYKNKTNDNPNNPNTRQPFNRIDKSQSTVSCFNCKERGHPFFKCPKPLIKCSQCNRFGHTADKCNFKEAQDNKGVPPPKTMCILAKSTPNSKFIKDAFLDDLPVRAFVDFGSEVSLIAKSILPSLGLESDNMTTALKGFGNEIVHTLGTVTTQLTIDNVSASVTCQVVEDKFLDLPLLVGQSFTEQAHVTVYKDAERLQFLDSGNEMPFSYAGEIVQRSVKILAVADVNVCGPVTIRCYSDPCMEGSVLLDSKVIGKPTQQCIIYGGIYQLKDGKVNVCVSPVSANCLILSDNILARATRVQMVNRIVSPIDQGFHQNNEIDVSKVRIGTNVGDEQKQKLLNLLQSFSHCFASNLQQLGCTNATEMTIDLNSDKPVVYRPYRLSHKEREQVRDMVDEMINADIIRESVSEYASPVILVRKKDGNLRMCIDYRMLNSITVKERYPMPVIEDEIARLSGQAYFITLDLASGYYQVPISEQSKPLTAFVTPDGQYEFNRMPFGLANAPAIFQRMMNKVLGSARYTKATAYIDDVLIFGRSVEECLDRLADVLVLIEKANLTLNLSKCDFLKDNIDYLGYEISASGVRPGDKKIQCVLDFPRPSNIHSVRQFLGLVGYFRKFIRDFARISNPLSRLLKKDATWQWSAEQEESFKELKEKLIDRPILAIYDPSAETELHTDASKLGIGGILMQRSGTHETFRPVAYYSRQTSPEEKNFHAYELETLAVVCSLKKFRIYLLGQQFKIVTDCSALRSTFSKRDIIPRIARWWLLLQEFHCSVEYRPGTKMTHVDALSRNPVPEVDTSSCDKEKTDQFPVVMTISSEDWLQTLQLGDTELCRIRDVLNSDLDADGLNHIKDNYLIKDDRLYKYLDGDKSNIRWVVPKGARWQLCQKNHDAIGHFGVEKTLERIKKAYWFPRMSKFIKKYVKACMECAYSKKTSTSKEGYLHPIEKKDIPFHTIHVDHLGPFVRSKKGNSYLLVVVDSFTKFSFIRPVRNTKTQNVIRILEDIFTTFRTPDRIVSDRGACFTSHAFKRFCLNKGIKHVLNAVASPRSNGQVERYNRTILSSLTALNLNRDERDWDEDTGKLQWGLNNTLQKTTGRTPSSVMFGTHMDAEIDPRLNEIRTETREMNDLASIRKQVKDRIDAEQLKQKEAYDNGRRPAKTYKEGDLVRITKTNFNNDGKSKKLLPHYIGPYRVVTVLGNDRYRVAAVPGLTSSKNKRKTTVAADRMLPWIHVAALEVNDDDSDVEGIISENDE